MKQFFLLFILLILISPVWATNCSKYTEKTFAEENNKEKVHITVKKEIITQYAQDFGDSFIPYIAYGYGDLKAKKMKKSRITYICLLDNDQLPFWSHVYFSK